MPVRSRERPGARVRPPPRRARLGFAVVALAGLAAACAGSDEPSGGSAEVSSLQATTATAPPTGSTPDTPPSTTPPTSPPTTRTTTPPTTPPTTPTVTPGTTTAPTGATAGSVDGGLRSGAEFSVVAAVSEIPADVLFDRDLDETIVVSVADVRAAESAAGISAPTDATDIEQLADWSLTLSNQRDNAGVFVPFPAIAGLRELGRVEEYVEELGFGPADIDAFADLSTPPTQFTVMTGPGGLPNDLPEVAPGVVTAGEGEDFSFDPETRTPARPLGRPLRLALDAGRVAASTSTPLTSAWVEGHTPITDDPRFGEVAVRLDDVGVVSATVYSGVFSPVPPLLVDVTTPLTIDSNGVGVFLSVGIGWNVDADGPLAAIVYWFPDAGLAEASVEPLAAAFEAPLGARDGSVSDIVRPESIRANGQTVVATVRFTGDGRPLDLLTMLLTSEPIFVHG